MFKIEHLKSGLAISTHMGCPLGCSYCVLDTIPDYGTGVKRLAAPEDLVKKILDDEVLYLDGMTPIIINNRTDPFLPDVEPDTMVLLKLLSERKIKSPVILISKIIPKRSLAEFYDQLNLLFFYSYSNIKSDFNYEHLKNIGRLKGIISQDRLFHYCRPIIPGINDDIDQIKKMLGIFAEEGFAGSVVSGLRVTKNNKNLLGTDDKAVYDYHHKILQPRLFELLCQEMEKTHISYQLFRHTSCAIDCFMKRRNRLSYYDLRNHCRRTCINRQKCAESLVIHYDEILNTIKNKIRHPIEYKVIPQGMEITSCINEEETAFIKNAFGIRVECSHVTLSPSEVFITNE